MKHRHIILMLFFSCGQLFSQAQLTDSLCCRAYEYYKSKFIEKRAVPSQALIYGHAWLRRAVGDKNNEQQMNAYKSLAFVTSGTEKLLYADSMIAAASRTGSKALEGSAYLSRGIIFYDDRKHQRALDDYLRAEALVSAEPDKYLTHKIKYQIGFTKYYLGYFHEAISLLNECAAYFEDENDRAYLNTLYGLSLCHHSLNAFSKSSSLNLMGIAAAHELEIPEMIPYFNLSEGINRYSVKEYHKAGELLKSVLPIFMKNNDQPNVTLIHFYLANVYWAQGFHEKALPYLLEVDQSFTTHNYLRPDVIKAYILLKDYYGRKNEPDLQLHYIDQLLKADSIAKKEHAYLSGKISLHQQYNTIALLQEKRKLESASLYRSITAGIIIFLLLALITGLYHRHLKNKKRIKKFEMLMRGSVADTLSRKPNSYLQQPLDLNDQVAETLLRKLEKFEESRTYLEKDMGLVNLAIELDTNQKYVTKVINHYRGKGTIEYISDLKIDFIIEKLKAESRYRRYTYKALGEEAGFGSTQIFTKAFKERAGMSPKWFIEQVEKGSFK